MERPGVLVRMVRAGRALGACLVALVLVAGWLAIRPGPRLSRRWVRFTWGLLLRGFALDVQVHGTAAAAPGTLYVANHVSWTDIVVLGYQLDAGFVAKSEVGRWPVIGRGARALGCIFVARERRGMVGAQAGEIAARLAAGGRLVLFAEGTTGDGSAVLPFHSSLFDGIGAGTIQPVTLVCRRRDGQAFSPAERRRFAWLDDDALLPHAAAMARSGGARVDVFLEAPVPGGDRKAVARACRGAIAARLTDQAAALNRAA